MKRIFLIAFVISTGLFLSCEKDDSLDPLPVKVSGQFARLDITNKVLKGINPTATNNFTQAETDASFFGGLLTSPSGKISEYKLYVKRRDGFGISSEFALVKTITSFPTELKVYESDIATALGLDPAVIGYGDEYYFYAESFDAAGKMANYFSLSATVQGAPGMKQAYRYRTTSQDKNYFDNPANLAEYDNYVNP